MRFALLIWFVVSAICPLMSQSDSSSMMLNLDTFTVSSDPISQQNRGYSIQHFNHLRLSEAVSVNLDEFLAQNTSIFIKDYGPSGISTLSFRGGSAAQSSLIWEGINIQNPQLGQADISLIPLSFIDQLDIMDGANTSSNGNSGLNGGIFIRTQPRFGKGWRSNAELRVGMYQQLDHHFNLSYGGPSYAGDIRFVHSDQLNNFHFWDEFNGTEPVKRQMDHAARYQLGLMTNHFLRLGKHQLAAKCWYLESDRELPPNLLQTTSTDRLSDKLLRSLISWKINGSRWHYKITSSFLFDDQLFANAAIESTHQTMQWFIDQTFQSRTNSGILCTGGLRGHLIRAFSSGLDSIRFQTNMSPYTHFNIPLFNNSVQLALSARTTIRDMRWVRPAFNVGCVYRPTEYWTCRASFAHNYRLPSLNDQYWVQGGNINIEPEYAWNIELGGSFEKTFNKIDLLFDLNLYQSWVENWILWSPNSNGLWEVNNVHRVWNKGAHFRAMVGGTIKDVAWRVHLNYTLALPTQYENTDLIQNGKRLLYSPDHSVRTDINITYRSASLMLGHQIISERFLDAYNSQSLPMYHIGSIECRYSHKLGRLKTISWIRLNNAYGHSYQIVSLRPMPLQIVQVGLKLFIE